MDEHIWEKVEADDPNRCQSVLPHKGQCWNKAVEGSNYCPAHGGNRAAEIREKESLRTYRLKKFQARASEFEDDDKIKSLRAEIAILRILIEERMNLCTSEMDLMMHSSQLSDLVMKVEKLVSSCNRLEGQLGTMLDKTQALQLGTEIVEIVARHVENEETLQAVADEILESIRRLGKPQAG